jgi:serine protease AprX
VKRFKMRPKGIIGLLTLALVFMLAQACIFAAPTDRKVRGKEKIREFSGGQLCKVQYADGALEDVIIYDTGAMVTYDSDKHSKLFAKAKITDKLQAALDAAIDKDAAVTVSIWLTDVDMAAVDTTVKKELQLTDLKKASAEQIKSYIALKRSKAKEQYKAQNWKFLTKYLDESAILLNCGYASLIIAKLNQKTIAEIVKDNNVLTVDLFVDAKKEDETTYSIPNINANYTKNLGYTGNGVTVGIVESGYCDKTNSQLSDRDINFDVSDSVASRRLSSHATVVTSIVVGNTQGIVPEATVYVAQALSRLQDYQKIEWLIDQGATVINYSAGYTDVQGTYSDMAKWIDHLGMQHNVHFVKSAGNYTSSYLITDPGMAYNAVVVGSMYDSNSADEPDWTDDLFSAFSRYTESSGGYKPDFTAPGQGIDIAGYSDKSGTSFAAPHVTAVLAQLVDYSSNLLVNNSLLKAICAAGTFHRTASDYGAYSLSAAYSNKEGTGVIDAKGAYTIAANAQYADLELTPSQFPYYISFTVSQTTNPVRVALAWVKQNTISASSHAGAAVTERALSDLDLIVYNPSNTAIASSVSGANNLELVQFVPSVTGTYRIKISGYTLQNSSEKVGVAWYQSN